MMDFESLPAVRRYRQEETARAAREIGEMACQMLRLAPVAGLRVGIKIEPAQGMSTGTAKTPKAVEGRCPASPVGEADAPNLTPHPRSTLP
jgi:hypothetical protein